MFPNSFQKLIDNFSSLPSIGPKLAERLVLYLFRKHPEELQEFAENLNNLKQLKSCANCYNIAEDNLCEICKNKSREKDKVCVVEDPLDIIPIERTNVYKGYYHVLGGTILTNNEKEAKNLKISELLERIKKNNIQEIIIATNPTTEGDATTFYLKNKIMPLKVKVSRLARGLSTGGDIEYADELTLSEALTGRKSLL